ncbi:hypothetical protein PHET_00985 [Paragonimus heterotremus]|uniref:Uncharacterized protein n=1 Tax=Paragonimus heterotremus TaxID=100268 RepID=A0A8J4WJJ3_9TREM|nr:hypothetical protein PHET_00985 [Paragonimus heterotremus]
MHVNRMFFVFLVSTVMAFQTDHSEAFSKVCELASFPTVSQKNITKIFGKLTKFEDLRKEMSSVFSDFANLPEKLVYMNKLFLSTHLRLSHLKSTEVSASAEGLLDSLSVLYTVPLSSQVINQNLNSRLEELMVIALSEAARSGGHMYSISDLLACVRSSKLAAYSLDILGIWKLTWMENVLKGLDHYGRLRIIIELTSSYLALQPSNTCQASLRRLTTGCWKSSTVVDSETGNGIVGTICEEFCINVLRGCLAPPMLFLPSQERDDQGRPRMAPWRRLFKPTQSQSVGIDPIEATFNTLLNSLNATNLMTLIMHAVERAKEEAPSLSKKLQAFCEKVSFQKATEVSYNMPSNSSEHRQESSNELSMKNLQIKYEELLQFMEGLRQRLTNLAIRLTDLEQSTDSLERRFCGIDNTETSSDGITLSTCWNGSTYGRYDRPVPPFTLEGQRTNPEIEVTEADLKLSPPSHNEQVRLGLKQSLVEMPLRDDETAEADDPMHPNDRLTNTWTEEDDSSGFVPITGDIDFLPVERHIPEPVQPLLPELRPDPDAELYPSCPSDDEDCIPRDNVPNQPVGDTKNRMESTAKYSEATLLAHIDSTAGHMTTASPTNAEIVHGTSSKSNGTNQATSGGKSKNAGGYSLRTSSPMFISTSLALIFCIHIFRI